MGRQLRELGSLLWPRECAGCHRWDQAICPHCRRLLQAVPQRVEERLRLPLEMPLWAVGDYREELRSVILAAKHAPTAAVLESIWDAGYAASVILPVVPEQTTWIIPAPSKPRIGRRPQVVTYFAAGIVAGLRDSGATGQLHQALRLPWRTRTQAGLGHRQRAANRLGVMRLARDYRGRSSGATQVFLVDDVAATGATLHEARRVLVAAGHRLSGAIVVAAAPGLK